MTLPAHLSGSYLGFILVDKVHPEFGFNTDGLLITGILGSIFPDVDFFFSKYVKDHHDSLLHSPLFWLVIYIFIYGFCVIIGYDALKNYISAFIIGVSIHFFLDWYSARTAGIRVFYPFSKKRYSLFPLNPQKGKIVPKIFPTREYAKFFKFYMENKFLLISEISLIVVGIIVFILNAI